MSDLTLEIWNGAKYVIVLFLGGGIWKLLDFMLKWKKQNADESKDKTDAGLKAFQVADESLAEWIDTAQKATRDLMIVLRLLGQVQDYVDDLIGILENAFEYLEKCEDPENPNPEIMKLKRQITTLIDLRSQYEISKSPAPTGKEE